MKIIFHLAIIVCLFSVLPFPAISQKIVISDKAGDIGMIVFQMGLNNQFESPFVGIANKPSTQFALYRQLEKEGGAETLLTLVEKSENAVVRLYAAKAYLSKFGKLLPSLHEKMLSDTSLVNMVDGCVLIRLPAGYLYGKRLVNDQPAFFNRPGNFMVTPSFSAAPLPSE